MCMGPGARFQMYEGCGNTLTISDHKNWTTVDDM